jgi:CheY-like chemotaxis protein
MNASGRSRLVLIVDDFDDALEMYEDLTFKGYRVVIARGGQEAVDIARAEHPAIILMDLRMPQVTGKDALRMLRADDAFSTVPIVAFTAHALENERATAILDGFDDVIAKPCLPEALAAAVDRLLLSGREVRS